MMPAGSGARPQKKGITPRIPGRKLRNRTVKRDKRRHKRRNRGGFMAGRLKEEEAKRIPGLIRHELERVATRCERNIKTFMGIIAIAALDTWWL